MKVHYSGQQPKKMSLGASGYDLTLSEGLLLEGPPGVLHMGQTGLRIAVPEGIDCQIRPRSSLYKNYGCIIPNSPGTIDSDYRGEILIPLVRLVEGRLLIPAGTRVAQLVFLKLADVDLKIGEILETVRGSNAFGSTGR
jgi:dUTP pyrophosphatase